MKLKKLDPLIGSKFNEYKPWKVSLCEGIFSFTVSMLVHMACVHFAKKILVLTAHYPFVYRDMFRHIRTIPIVATSKENYVYLMNNPDHPLHQNSMILPVENEVMKSVMTKETERSLFGPLRDIIRRTRERIPMNQQNENLTQVNAGSKSSCPPLNKTSSRI